MTSNAVADCAKAREMDEKTLFKDGRQRIVEIGSLRESPQFLSDLGRLRCKAKEIWQNPESRLYLLLNFRHGTVPVNYMPLLAEQRYPAILLGRQPTVRTKPSRKTCLRVAFGNTALAKVVDRACSCA